jgi:LuxR family maltose regulon positive regulatory protein
MALSTQIPLPANILKRPRLLDRLDLNLAYKIAILSAPPGYGKTTLAVQFAHDVSAPVAWLALEDRHRDVTVLHHACLNALCEVLPVMSELTFSTQASPADLATSMARFLSDNLKQRLVVVLDDVHHLVDASDAEVWLRAFVDTMPRNCRLLLLSRSLPKLPLSEMIAHRELVALSAEDLRFSPDEISQLLANEPTDQTWALIDRLEGWPAGLMLALYPIPAEVSQAVLGNTVEPEGLFQHLAMALLDRQPPGLRQFLLESSTLTTVTPERCRKILGLADARHWLDDAHNRNLFLMSANGGLTYHALFRDFLQAQLKTQNQARFDQLHQQAAHWFAEDDQADIALTHCMAADLFDLAVTIAEQQAQPYFSQGRHETLLAWARWLRTSEIQTPRLWYTCAIIHLDRYDYDEAEVELARAMPVFVARDDQAGIVNATLQQATIALFRGAYHEAIALAQTMLARLDEPSGERGVMLNVLGLARIHLGDMSQAVSYLETALPLYRKYSDRHALATLLQSLEVAYLRCQRLEEAEACIQEVIALRQALGHTGALAMALNNLGYHYHMRGDYQQAEHHFREGLNLIIATSDRRAEAYLMWSLGDLQRDRGNFDEARSHYDKALHLAGSHEASLQCAILLSLSTLQRWQGRGHEAAARAQEALHLAESHDMALETTHSQLLLQVAQSLSDPDSAIPEDSLTDFKAHREDMDRLQGNVLCAQIALNRQDIALARRYLDPVFEHTRKNTILQPVIAEIYHHLPLRTLVEYKTTSPLALLDALKVLDRAQLSPPVEESPPLQKTYSLRIHTLGQVLVECDGEVVTNWQSNRARDMFMRILLCGPLSRDNICLHLWPDGTAQQVNTNFHTTLRFLRKALGHNVILYQDGLYLVDPAIDCWCDVQVFEALIEAARIRPPATSQAEALWRKATNLYRGVFLAEMDADWADIRREALHEMALDALVSLGRCLFARGDHKGALVPFQQALAVDPYREDIHRDLMRCYAGLGALDRVARQYRQLEQVLHHDLAVTPSPESQALLAELIEADNPHFLK